MNKLIGKRKLKLEFGLFTPIGLGTGDEANDRVNLSAAMRLRYHFDSGAMIRFGFSPVFASFGTSDYLRGITIIFWFEP